MQAPLSPQIDQIRRDWAAPSTITGPVTEERVSVLLYIYAGTATVEAAGVVHHLVACDVMWIPPGVAHRTVTAEGSVVLPLFPRIGELPRALSRIRVFSTPSEWREWIVHLHVDSRHTEVHLKDSVKGTRHLLNVVADRVRNSYDPGPIVPTAPVPTSVEALSVARTLVQNPSLTDSVRSFAEAEKISTITLQRQFRDETGITFSEWRTHARITAAAKLLQEGHDVRTVGHRVGYETPNGFGKAFKATTGISPREFIVRHRRAVAGAPPPAAVPAASTTSMTSDRGSGFSTTATIPYRRTWTSMRPYHYLL